MPELRFTQAAAEDLASIADYTIERHGVRQARSYRDRLFRAFDLIVERPFIGSNQSHVRSDTRRLVHESHGIYYEVGSTEILVLRILGPGQDPTRHLR